MVQIVNAVGSGSLGIELDLNQLALSLPDTEYDPEKYPGVYLRFSDDSPLTIIYRTGKYIITGGGSPEELEEIRGRFLELLLENGVNVAAEDEWFQLQNLVCTAALGVSLDLSTLALSLGLERTEYEPEQFPGLVYRPPDEECVVLIFGSGRVVLTGSSDLGTAERMFEELLDIVGDLEGRETAGL